jgi:hypothetical protein
MESERTMHSRRPYAPTNYRVLINNTDHAALDPANGSLRTDLGESLRRYARAHGYTCSPSREWRSKRPQLSHRETCESLLRPW